ncbi:MAG: AEC family transporter, partial [Lachnospiraceae bacterium]|nr:AEC family transporter [Lachnospiraceae bacterium]
MDIFIVLKQMCILLAMMMTGYITCKLGFVDRDAYSKLSKIVVTIFNPILIIDSVIGKSLSTTGLVFWENLILVFFFYTLLFLAGFLLLLLLRPNAVDSPIYRLMMLLPNIGFMGIPIVASLLGTDYIIYVACCNQRIARRTVICCRCGHTGQGQADDDKRQYFCTPC